MFRPTAILTVPSARAGRPWLEFLHFSRVAGLGKSAVGKLKSETCKRAFLPAGNVDPIL
jgi:hypothetical protein